jgi:hypothetical protein
MEVQSYNNPSQSKAPTAAAQNARATPTIIFVPADDADDDDSAPSAPCCSAWWCTSKREYLVSVVRKHSQSSSYAT